MIRWNLQQFAGEKTERATPQKRREVRQSGRVAKSADLSAAVVLFAVLLGLDMAARSVFSTLEQFMRTFLVFGPQGEWTQLDVKNLALTVTLKTALAVAPVGLVAVAASIVVSFVQTGVVFSLKPIMPDVSRVNPLEGLKRIVSGRSLVELGKSVLKVIVTGAAAYSAVSSIQSQMANLTNLSAAGMVGYLAQAAFGISVRVAAMLIVISILDFVYQRFEFERSIRMSKQDVRDELKRTEGNPLIRRRMRERQRQMAMARMMQDVPHADVVITNPTHFAVALRYDGESMSAPEVVAKGMDELAERIKEVARRYDVALVENRPLAQMLYRTVDVGKAVPAELYQTVAEVLAYVYRLRRRT